LPDGEVTRQGRRVEPLTLLIGVSMTIGYGTLYYPFAILGPEIARAQGWSNSFVFGVFSVALLTSAVTASLVGRAMDRFGARPVMVAGSCLAALALVNLSAVHSMTAFIVAMLIIELGARMVQYETGFAALTAIHGRYARRPIAHVTLVAGFASTVFWPLIHWLLGFMDWRGVCLVLAAINVLVALPIHMLQFRTGERGHLSWNQSRIRETASARFGSKPLRSGPARARQTNAPAFLFMAIAFAGGSFLMSAVHTSFFLILDQMGRAAALAALAGAVIGPMQVAARLDRDADRRAGCGLCRRWLDLQCGTLLLGLACLAAGLWIDGELIVIIAFAVSFRHRAGFELHLPRDFAGPAVRHRGLRRHDRQARHRPPAGDGRCTGLHRAGDPCRHRDDLLPC
jgi:MFS family permease